MALAPSLPASDPGVVYPEMGDQFGCGNCDNGLVVRTVFIGDAPDVAWDTCHCAFGLGPDDADEPVEPPFPDPTDTTGDPS